MVLSWSRFSVLPPTSCKTSDKMLNPFASVSPHAKWEGQCLPSLLIDILQSTFATCEDKASWQVPGVIHQPAMNSAQHEGWTQPWCDLGTAQLGGHGYLASDTYGGLKSLYCRTWLLGLYIWRLFRKRFCYQVYYNNLTGINSKPPHRSTSNFYFFIYF